MGKFVEKFLDAAEQRVDAFAERLENLDDQADYAFDGLLRAGNVDDVKAVFKELETLDAKTRKKVVSRLEQLLIEDDAGLVREFKEDMKEDPESIAEALKEPGDAENAKDVEMMLGTYQPVLQILGDKAQPYTKTVVQKLKEMTAEDRQSDAKLALLVVEAYDQAQSSLKNPVSKGVRKAKGLITKGILNLSNRR